MLVYVLEDVREANNKWKYDILTTRFIKLGHVQYCLLGLELTVQ